MGVDLAVVRIKGKGPHEQSPPLLRLAQELKQVAKMAECGTHGTVLVVCEQVALNEGRALLRTSAAVQSRVALAEPKRAAHAGGG
jgi:hypothetical protein